MTEEKRKSSQKKSDKQHTVKIPVTQIASEKVDATVTTFLIEDSVKVPTIKLGLEKITQKVPLWWEPFCRKTRVVCEKSV